MGLIYQFVKRYISIINDTTFFAILLLIAMYALLVGMIGVMFNVAILKATGILLLIPFSIFIIIKILTLLFAIIIDSIIAIVVVLFCSIYTFFLFIEFVILNENKIFTINDFIFWIKKG